MTSSQAPGEGNLAESPELAARGEVAAELRPRLVGGGVPGKGTLRGCSAHKRGDLGRSDGSTPARLHGCWLSEGTETQDGEGVSGDESGDSGDRVLQAQPGSGEALLSISSSHLLERRCRVLQGHVVSSQQDLLRATPCLSSAPSPRRSPCPSAPRGRSLRVPQPPGLSLTA